MYFDGYNPLEPYRKEMRRINKNMRYINNVSYNISNITPSIRILNNSIASQLSMQNELTKTIQYISELAKTNINVPDLSHLFKTTTNVGSYFEDFRKNVLVNETENELMNYSEEEISVSDFNSLKAEVFNLKKK